MNGRTYAYLDLAALPVVGSVLLDPRPAFVFRGDGSGLLWANAEGIQFLGEKEMGAALEKRFSTLNPLTKQIARLAKILPSDHKRMEILRFSFGGVAQKTLAAACQRLNLSEGAAAVLVIGSGGNGRESLVTRAETLADMLGGRDRLSAVLDEDGRVLGASGGFDELRPASDAIDAMVEGVAGTSRRVLKREIDMDGMRRHAGIARVTAGDETLYLLIVGPPEAIPSERAKPAPVFVSTETIAPAAPPAPVTASEPSAAAMPVESEYDIARAVDEAVREIQSVAEALLTEDIEAALIPDLELPDFLRRDATPVEAAEPELPLPEPLAEAEAETAPDPEPRPPEGEAPAPVTQASAASEARASEPQEVEAATTPEQTQDAASAPGPVEDEPSSPNIAETPAEEESIETEAPVPDDLDDVARISIERGLTVVSGGRDAKAETPVRPAPSNVVRLPGAAAAPPRQPAGETLTGAEHDAFRRIAEALGARRVTDKTEKEEPPEAPATALPEPTADELRRLDRIPVALVVFRDRKTIFANRTLLDLLGYASIADFAASGGADSLFPGQDANWNRPGSEAPDGRMAAKRRDGSNIIVEARLHSVPWGGATALMLSLREVAETPAEETPATVAPMPAADRDARIDELEAILDTATDGVIVIDGKGRIDRVNRSAEALFGIEARKVLGEAFTDLLAEESRKAALDYLDGLAANGVASVLNDGREVIGKVPQGGLIPLFMTMGRLGDTGKFCAVLRDITQWKNAEEELVAAKRAAEQANQQKSDFLAKISHEIRTPLNAIIGFSEVMIEERFGPIENERYRNYLRDIHVSGAHLMSLINDLLDLSKIEAGKLDLAFESVAVNGIIQECVALMQPQANRQQIIIRTSLSSSVPNVVADPRSLRQILLNLLSNAVKFTRAGGQVIVSTALEDRGEVVIRVRDTGIGMSEKDIETALKPFRQLATTNRERGEGTGLGLPLTKALVEANRATFSIDSAVNQGTLVRVIFPTTRVLAG